MFTCRETSLFSSLYSPRSSNMIQQHQKTTTYQTKLMQLRGGGGHPETNVVFLSIELKKAGRTAYLSTKELSAGGVHYQTMLAAAD